MKIIISGSLGNVGRPLTKQLVTAGHDVTVISHTKERKKDIEDIGAKAAIGSLNDADFLTTVFAGADAAFAMTPPVREGRNAIANTVQTGQSFARAIERSGIPRVVMLSSMGADMPDKNGPIAALYNIEKIYSGLENTAFTFLRAGSFYLNFYMNIPMIKKMGIIGANLPGEMPFPLVHPRDIATAAAQLLQSDFTGKQVRYIVSDIRTPNEIASVLGAAIGNPGLHWVEFTDEQSYQGMKQGGLPEEMATLLTEMNAGYRSGRLFKEFEAHGSPVNGQVKLEEFAQEFAMQFTGVPVA